MLREEVRLYGCARVEEAIEVLIGTRAFTLAEIMGGNYALMKPRERAKAEALAFIIKEKAMADAIPTRITSPRNAGEYLTRKCAGWTEERFGLLALNAKGNLLADRILSQGTATATCISPREFFREALRLGAFTALAYHNHPSGDPTPSQEDTVLTNRLRSAGDSLGVPLADHLVIGGNAWHSFRAAQGWDNRP